ncbi:thiol:disulfide interchange protein DsbA [Niveibacterium umoris]|uniref:Thiol:disulfide interchange protein n=1 Tax=Niveibacterium umoris TaxID=1193620 RepID=A0A840BLG5_9RHOO|nr:thiol:disulfide interchange protein DsbA/DsbL [Niveibacterium umoris]MBB4013850.1 thiol:disulfide interchange protein DsbA [Niveibacterium umoris]
MNRRDLIKQLASFAALAAVTSPALAQKALQVGKDFRAINPAQPTESGDRVEVIEFFSFGCPHCHELEPSVAGWVKRLPKDVLFRRIPITFNRDAWAVLAKMYLTYEVMGETEKMVPLTFSAVHNDHVPLEDEAARNAWLQKSGINVAKFNENFRSFSVGSKLQRATQVAAAYQIQGVPTMVVDGKFMTAPSMTNSLDGTLVVVDQLIARARTERGRK